MLTSRALGTLVLGLSGLNMALLTATFYVVDSRARAEAPCGAATAEVHYAPAENLEKIDVEALDQAGETIDMAAYVLTDAAIAEALKDAGERGVRVRIWRDPEMAERAAAYDQGAALAGVENIEARTKAAGGELMHLKGYCVDGALLRTGSANFSRSGELTQDNDLVFVRGKAPCAGFEAKFDEAWSGK